VTYTTAGQRKIGILRKFFNIENSIFCIVQNLTKRSNLIEETEDTKPLIAYLDRFFLICKFTDSLTLIRIEQIQLKCVLLIKNDEVFVSIFNESDTIMD
jgi:hypothetical protein